MKREYFVVSSDRGPQVVKHAWNSSLQAAVGLVHKVARDEGCCYELTASEYHKDEGRHVRGSQTWTGTNGKQIVVRICKM